nr:hypothetical protein [Kibdelosporangium sp. MJ126-NF4]
MLSPADPGGSGVQDICGLVRIASTRPTGVSKRRQACSDR